VKRIPFIVFGMICGGAIAFLLFRSSALIVIFAALFGLFGFLQAYNPPVTNQDSDRPKKIQFSLLRLLLATSMVALVFGLSRYLYDFKQPVEIIASSVIAFALGGLTLISTKSDLKHIFGIIIVVFLGILLIYVITVSSIHFTG
jgi:FtsH-binding integral membrane protein